MSKKLNILYHHRTLGDGAEGIHIKEIVQCLKKDGHRVKLLSLIGEKTNEKTEENQKWERFKNLIPPFLYEFVELVYNIPGYFMLRKEINKSRPDLIYDRYAHYSLAALVAGKFHKIPLILEVNSPYSIQKRMWEKLYFPRISRFIEKRIFKMAPHIIVVSTPLKDIVKDYGIPENRITVLPNGTDFSRFNPEVNGKEIRKKYNLGKSVVMGFVGILRKWHNVEVLIDVLTELDMGKLNMKMLFVGDGPIMNDLIEYVKSKGQENNIFFVGRVSHEKIPEYIAAMDIAISPHATFYSSPMKILEYMAMKKAIIAPKMKNIEDLIEDHRSGLLFETNDKQSMKDKILEMVTTEKLRKDLGNAAYDVVSKKFSWEKNAHRSIDIAAGLISSN